MEREERVECEERGWRAKDEGRVKRTRHAEQEKHA